MWTFLKIVLFLFLLGVLTVTGAVVYYYDHYSEGLPDHRQLKDYQPSIVTRIHAGDGRLLSEYAHEKRVFVPIQAIPETLVQAFLSAEDKQFYSHPGINFFSVARAGLTNLSNKIQGNNRRPIGASTITQQVAKNFLLTNEVSLERKAKEAILALRIERAMSKDKILELYLNEINLGNRSYGVAAAALNYFDKSLDELTIAESAFLAALPKAPNRYHPRRNYIAAIQRRNWVLKRMWEDGYLTKEELVDEQLMPIKMANRRDLDTVQADYFAEEVRRWLIETYGEEEIYSGGYTVRTTLNPDMQRMAEHALAKGLLEYDKRHGWRGALGKLTVKLDQMRDTTNPRLRALQEKDNPYQDFPGWSVAVVDEVLPKKAVITLQSGQKAHLLLDDMKWAKSQHSRGAAPVSVAAVLEQDDIIYVSKKPLPEEEAKDTAASEDDQPPSTEPPVYVLQQKPRVNGGLVAMDPHTGRVLALVGGFDYGQSEYNRATQAFRQPGSTFKPFVYLAALEQDYSPTSLVMDAPIVVDQGNGEIWRPRNYTKRFYGLSTMRLGLQMSRNLMTIRIAQVIGMEKVSELSELFGIYDDLPPLLAMSLGAGETTLLRLTAAYAIIANSGKKVTPMLIDRIQDRNGKTIFKHDKRVCQGCRNIPWSPDLTVPEVEDNRPQLVSPASAYQATSLLQGVIQRGTGVSVREVGKPLAGKTGTTNDNKDAWFVGYSPDLAVGVYVGFDTPRSLGRFETGSRAAAPIFKYFMQEALADQPALPFRVPPGISLVRVNASNGNLARPGDRRVILEAFKPGQQYRRKEITENEAWNVLETDRIFDEVEGIY